MADSWSTINSFNVTVFAASSKLIGLSSKYLHYRHRTWLERVNTWCWQQREGNQATSYQTCQPEGVWRFGASPSKKNLFSGVSAFWACTYKGRLYVTLHACPCTEMSVTQRACSRLQVNYKICKPDEWLVCMSLLASTNQGEVHCLNQCFVFCSLLSFF